MPKSEPESGEAVRPGDRRTVISPDGRFRIDFLLDEGRHSHWIETPTITDLETGKEIFAFRSSSWDAAEEWHGDGRFSLYIRRYPDPYTLPIHFDADRGTVWLDDDPDEKPISTALTLIERHFASQFSASLPRLRPEQRSPVPREIRWLQAFFVLVALGFAVFAYLKW